MEDSSLGLSLHTSIGVRLVITRDEFQLMISNASSLHWVYLLWTVRTSWARLQVFIAVWGTTEISSIQEFCLEKLSSFAKSITLEIFVFHSHRFIGWYAHQGELSCPTALQWHCFSHHPTACFSYVHVLGKCSDNDAHCSFKTELSVSTTTDIKCLPAVD